MNEKGGKGQLATACTEATVKKRLRSGVPPSKHNLKEIPPGKIFSSDFIQFTYTPVIEKHTQKKPIYYTVALNPKNFS